MAYKTTTANRAKPGGFRTTQVGTAPAAPTPPPVIPGMTGANIGAAAGLSPDMTGGVAAAIPAAAQKNKPRILPAILPLEPAPPQPVGQPRPPGPFEELFAELAPLFKTPGAAEELMGALQQMGFFTTPTESQEAYAGSQDFFDSPSASQDFMGALQMMGFFTDPSQSQQFQETVGQGMEHMTGAGNEAAQFFAHHMAGRPDVSSEPGLDRYYDTAVDRVGEDMKRVGSARGSYGGTAAQDMEGRRIGELRADQSKHEADYNLRRLAEDRMWEGLGGSLAGASSEAKRGWTDTLGQLSQASDAAKLANIMGGAQIAGQADTTALDKKLGGMEAAGASDRAMLDRIMGGADIASGADTSRMQRLLGLLGFGPMAQEFETTRERQPFADLGPITDTITGITQPGYEGMHTSDQDILETIASFIGGTTKENMTQAGGQRNAIGQTVGKILEFAGLTGNDNEGGQ